MVKKFPGVRTLHINSVSGKAEIIQEATTAILSSLPKLVHLNFEFKKEDKVYIEEEKLDEFQNILIEYGKNLKSVNFSFCYSIKGKPEDLFGKMPNLYRFTAVSEIASRFENSRIRVRKLEIKPEPKKQPTTSSASNDNPREFMDGFRRYHDRVLNRQNRRQAIRANAGFNFAVPDQPNGRAGRRSANRRF